MKLPSPNEIRKPSKTLAGVTPIAVMCKPRKCKHGVCLYCPSLNVPQSYTPKSPPVLRAIRLAYDSYEQVISRLKAFSLMNHPIQKIELIIMGGNFLDYPVKYQYDFVKGIYDALNEFDKNHIKIDNDADNNSNSKYIDKDIRLSDIINRKLARQSSKRRLLSNINEIEDIKKQLEEAKKRNEKAKHRCVALCIETRPDTCLKKGIIKRMLEFGCTRVELGVQCLDDKIYKFVNRGHKVEEVVEATKKLKNANFKVFYHMMLGLPLSNPSKDYKMFVKLFKDERFKPDGLKIYPCQVIKGAGLEKLYKKGKYKPYSQKQIEELLKRIMFIIPNYCRVMRIMREIPPDYLIAGILRIDLRRDFENALKDSKLRNKINEIRFREIGFAVRDNIKINKHIKLKITKYNASEGKEYFLEFVNKDNILFGLLRLRINKEANTIFGAIRELHVYGQALNLGKKAKTLGQHSGFGKILVKKAEEIAKINGVKELDVIAGVGVREYFYKLGYKRKGVYVSKSLK